MANGLLLIRKVPSKMSRTYDALRQADSGILYRVEVQKTNDIAAKIRAPRHDKELMVEAYTKISKYSLCTERSMMLLHILAGRLR